MAESKDRAEPGTGSAGPTGPLGSAERGELQQARAHLAAIVESSEDGIVGKTLDGIVTSWNQGAERLFGYSAAEMVGQPIAKLIPPELQHQEADILSRIHRDGHRLNISLTISPVRDRNGRIVGAAKIAHDVTARKRAESALEEEARA